MTLFWFSQNRAKSHLGQFRSDFDEISGQSVFLKNSHFLRSATIWSKIFNVPQCVYYIKKKCRFSGFDIKSRRILGSGKFLKKILTVENSNLNLKIWPLEFWKNFQGADLKFIGGDWRELFKFYISGLKMIIKNLVCWWKITKDNRFMINHPKILNLTLFNHMFLSN